MKKTLLIVEPDDDIRSKLAQELSDLTQMLVIQARDGLQAYQKTRNQPFDVILTEFNTSKLGGPELIASIRETDHNLNTPFIIYTEDIENAKIKTRGAKHVVYIKKPAELTAISDQITSLSKIDLDKKQFKIDVDFINPFIDSSVKTLNAMCGVKTIDAQRPYLLTENEVLDIDISGNLSITSPYFRGSIGISFAIDVYKKLISAMLEEGQENITTDNQDGAAEIINIIFGQTKAVLNTRGYSLARAIPSVVRGPGHKIYPNSKIPVLLVPFTSDAGNFYIQICVKAI
jgi:chemotaxis protein CheX